MSSTSEFLGNICLDTLSDELFVGLFLPVPGKTSFLDENATSDKICPSIPWKYCDRILSMFQDPRFNSREVSFKDYGDMFLCIGKKKEEARSIVEARPRDSGIIPQVVVQNVFDLIWSTIEKDLDSGNIWDRTRIDDNALLHRKSTIRRWMRVHSSWYAYGRRLLGSRIASRRLSPIVVQNPLFGRWTRELQLVYSNTATPWTPPHSPRESHPRLLTSLCARIPATQARLVRIEFSAVTALDKTYEAVSHDAILTLTALEELHFTVDAELSVLQTLISVTSETHHPSLRVLCLYIRQVFSVEYIEAVNSEFTRQPHLISPLSSLPKLQMIFLIHLDIERRKQRRYGIPIASGTSWSRVSPANASPIPFALDSLRLECPGPFAETYEDTELRCYSDETLREASQVEFRLNSFEAPPNQNEDDESTGISSTGVLGRMLRLCTSARSIAFRDFPWRSTSIFEELERLESIPRNIEELTIIAFFPLSSYWTGVQQSDKDNFISNDARLSNLIASGWAPSLRTLNVLFKFSSNSFEDMLRELTDDATGRRSYENRGLMHCSKRCLERNIKLHVASLEPRY